jgi:hypothetical protein
MTPEEELELIQIEQEMRRRKTATPAPTPAAPKPRAAPPPSNDVTDAGKAFATGASRWATLGMDDEASGVMTGLLEAFSPTSLSDEGDDVLTRLQKGYRQGKVDRRALVEDMSTRSPNAYNTGAGAGAGLAAALTPATAGARILAAGIAGPGIADVELDDPAAPSEAARSVALGQAGGAVIDKVTGAVIPVVAPAAARVVDAVKGAASRTGNAGRAGATKGADAIKVLIDKVDEAPVARAVTGVVTGGSSEGALLTARGAEKALRRVGAGGAKPAAAPDPAPTFARTATDPLDEMMAAGVPPAAPAPVVPPKANPLATLVDEPMPTMPPRNPRTPAAQIPRVAPPMPAPAPVAPPTPAPGAAVPLSDAELQAMIRGVITSPQMRQLERVQQQMTRAPGVATDPLDEMSKRLIRQGNASTSNTNPVAIDDVGGRAPKVVAAVGQQEKWRGIYDRLSPDQRASFIEQLRRESGLTDDQIRQRLKLTMAEWRRKSFTREAP